tara:strand:+ start:297 stop:950 length:654 start_codon:yes stop_codon:yes gene_type:complete
MKTLNSLADLKYGKMNIEDIEFIEKSRPQIDEILWNFISEPYPDSRETSKEIEYIKDKQEAYTDKYKMRFCKDADEDLTHTLTKLLQTIGIEVDESLFDINKVLGYIIVKLKQHYNRPRPYQFAYYSEQDFHPYETITGNSPSYPSGHALQGYFLCSLLSKKYPEHKTRLNLFADMIAESRVALGVHYPSDNAFSKEISNKLMKYEKTLWQSVKDRA